ncbi:MAG: TIGR04222 domain-containing membrane protein [Bryobacterales bacterium]|nr:TIGR04222 domain-containing membrane protein [Bryobacterales bacterium]
MNPFDLRGPEFLVLYIAVSVTAILAAYLNRRRREGADTRPLPKLEDPYLIAYLRGGREGAVETAMISLIDRQRIVVENGQMLKRTDAGVHHPLEKALLQEVASPRQAQDARKLRSTDASLDGYETHLVKQGLLPDATQKAARLRDAAFVCIALSLFALAKIAIALARGRTNIILLIVFMVVSLIVAFAVCNPRLTARGKRTLEHLRTLLDRLKDRAETLRPNQHTQELMLLAAAFGVMAIPAAAMPQRPLLYPANTSSADGGSDSGSSCGSSCGGGCGGGCGGCGS